MNVNYLTVVGAAIIAVGIVISGVLINLQIASIAESQARFTKNAAIDGCYQVGRVINTNSEKQTINMPEQSWYVNCMKEKGYNVNGN